MDTLLHRFGAIIKGTIEGFDRLVFKGIFRPISFAAGMQVFLLRAKGVLNKDYKNWVIHQSAGIIQAAEEYSQKHCGRRIIYIPSINTRKEELAHRSAPQGFLFRVQKEATDLNRLFDFFDFFQW